MSEPTLVPVSTPTSTDGAGRTPRHLWDYWRIFWEGRRILGGTIGATLIVALVGTLLMPKRYSAEALVEVNLVQPAVLGSVIERGGARGFFDEDREFRTEFVKIKTKRMLDRAIEKEKLVDAVPDLAKSHAQAAILAHALDVDRLTQTNVAKITVSWGNPVEAAAIANAVATTYCAADLDERIEELNSRIARLEGSLEEKRGAGRDVIERDLATIKTNPPLETILGLSTMKANSNLQKLWTDLKDAERSISEMSGTFGAASAEMRNGLAVRDRIRSQIDDSRKVAVANLENEYRGLGGDPDAVKPQFHPITSTEQEINEKYTQQLLERLNDNKILLHTAEAKAHVIEPATAPANPYSPRLWLNLTLAIVVGLGFGGGYVLFRDFLDVSVKTLDDVEQDLGLNVLAVVPRHDTATPDLVVKEAFQTLRTGLLFASGGRRSRVLLVTSGAPQEGKSTIVSQLARSIAAGGESVVVVDCDMRRGTVARQLGVKPGQSGQGLSNYLADASARSWKDVVVEAGPKLSVIPTGPVPPNPVDLLGLDRFRTLLHDLRGAYDWVILDSAPVSSVSDAVLLASLAEMIMVVVRHDTTDKEVIRRALQRVRAVGGHVIGAVLNDVDMSKTYNRDYYYGRFYYGSYYGKEDDASTPGKPSGGGTGRSSRSTSSSA
jgi:capsular exopolysaccharide synthesis family protein